MADATPLTQEIDTPINAFIDKIQFEGAESAKLNDSEVHAEEQVAQNGIGPAGMAEEIPSTLTPEKSLKRSREEDQLEPAHPPQLTLSEDSPVTKAEKVERNGVNAAASTSDKPPAKKVRLEDSGGILADKVTREPTNTDTREKVNGIALVKAEYLIDTFKRPLPNPSKHDNEYETQISGEHSKTLSKKGQKGQNKNREFGSWYDKIRLCNTLATSPEFSPKPCKFGDKCKCTHDLRKYLKEGKREDLKTFNGKCPVFEQYGTCYAGWKCRFVSSHSNEIEREDGRKELVLIEKENADVLLDEEDENRIGVVNVASTQDKLDLARKRFKTEKADQYNKWLEQDIKDMEKFYHAKKDMPQEEKEAIRAQYTEPPFLPSEKRRIYFGPETPMLAPLTTQGNLPFRRLCVEFGAQLTYSEMAMALPIIQGQKGEWALMKAHHTEIQTPNFSPKSTESVVQGYDNSKDLRFGVQISANKPWMALRAAEVLSKLVPHLRVIDLNCGCPIDLVCRTGAGSSLLDTPSKLEKMIRGMNAVSGEVPITAKIRMGTKDKDPTATKTIQRLAFGGFESGQRHGAPGCAAITLHGRSKQQRYTKTADWSYIAECAALVESYNKKKDELTDTVREPDERTLANSKDGRMYFMGNGDCYSHVHYLDHIENARVDSVMVARGALVKPWIFEEIEKGQYVDKSATERLQYVEKFVKYGLEAWGSDEVGVGQTRRFLLEWLSFAHRYVPVGILDHLPPSLQDRPPAYRGRNDLETLLASDNYLDWMKISEMYLGPAHKDFKFVPKHKSNSYEIEAEG